jgi:hypothetical protein
VLKVPKQDSSDMPLGGIEDDPMMGNDMAGDSEPMGDDGIPPDNEGMPPSANDENEPPMGDGADNSDQQELDDIFNSASLEVKNAILKYAKSQTDNDDKKDQDIDDEDMPPMQGDEEDSNTPQMPNESKRYKNHLVNEIMNGIISDFDMNDRNKVKGTKRDEKRITNNYISKSNPFVSGR